jgi:hypothetical protein
MTNLEALHKTFRDIAKLHGAKLIFVDSLKGGRYWNGIIVMGRKGSLKEQINIFCHELGHFKNDLEDKYPVYHQIDAKKAIKKMGFKAFVDYALRAEIYTDKVGKQLCKIWFPKYKYEIAYSYTEYWKGFMYGYYLPEAG